MPQRPRNPAGFVRKHPDTAAKRWQGIVKYWDVTEERWRQRAKTFGKPAEAQAWVDAAVMEHRKTPGYRPPTDDTFGEYLNRWLDAQATRGLSPKTLEDYRYMARHAQQRLGAKRLAGLTPWDFQDLYAHMVHEGLSNRTVAYVHAVVRHALRDAVDWGLLPQSPMQKVKGPRSTRRDLQVPTPDEARHIVAATSSHRLFALWATITATGLRRGEALGLKWADIDWDRATLTVSRALSGTGTRRRIGPTKRPRSSRQVALNPWLLDVLRGHRDRQQEEMAFWGGAPTARPEQLNMDLVFTTRSGTWLDPRHVLRDFHRQLDRAGLPHCRIHDLRHAMASEWIAAGVNIQIVSERLGHASIAFTLEVYGHLLPHAQADAAVRMGEAWVGVTTASPRTQGTEATERNQ